MHRISQRVLRILDGSPGALGGYQRGQSLVELLLITPLLIIMVAGIIEIGWYANHVLILLEVTRVGARQATLFTGELGYQSWNNTASIHPIAYKLTNGFNTVLPTMDDFKGTTGALYAIGSPAGVPPNESSLARDCKSGKPQGFYTLVVCSMMNALDPLTIKGRGSTTSDIIAKRIRKDFTTTAMVGREYNGGRIWFTYKYDELYPYPDDMVVSVFSLQAINNVANRDTATIVPTDPLITTKLTSDSNLYSHSHDFGSRFPRGYQVIVVGRYPTNANECNVVFTPTVGPSATPSSTQLAIGENYIQRIMVLGAADYDYLDRSWDGNRGLMTAPSTIAGTFATGIYNDTDPLTYLFRDPFDYYNVGNGQDIDTSGVALELSGADAGPEYQRGFVMTGQHVVNSILDTATGRQLFCYGSDWSDQRVQDIMNSPSFLQKGVTMPPKGDPKDSSPAGVAWQAGVGNLTAYNEWQTRAKFLPSQGAVLVEMYWRHDILLDFPLMYPIMRLMEGAGGPNNIIISVWAVFPLPAAEPNLNYGFPPAS